MIVSAELPDVLGADVRVRVQIHMQDGPEFEAIVRGREVQQMEGFRFADVVLPSGHEAIVFGQAGPLRVGVAAVLEAHA